MTQTNLDEISKRIDFKLYADSSYISGFKSASQTQSSSLQCNWTEKFYTQDIKYIQEFEAFNPP